MSKKTHHKEHDLNHEVDHEIDHQVDHETEKNLKHTTDSSSKTFLDKHLNTSIAILGVTIILVGGFGGIWYYQQISQQAKQQAEIPTFINQDPKTQPKVADANNKQENIDPKDLEKISKLSISKDIPELKDFVMVLDAGSTAPNSSLEIDKQPFLSQNGEDPTKSFIGGLDLTLSTDFDQNNQKEALVQSIYLYKEGFTEKLKIKDYSPAGYQKIACENVGDECGILYKKAAGSSQIDSYKIHIRKNNILLYLEYAGNPKTHPEHNVEWLKKVSSALLSKI